jgi:stearoyl-CoA desaturase (delta-9 desaturase)
MHDRTELSRIFLADAQTNALQGSVHWAPAKSLWLSAHFLVALVGGALTFSWSALGVFFITTAATLCLGHSLGMHRRLIHNSYECPRWLEYFLVHCGVLVGLAGPFGMTHTHDLRDWAQRQGDCHSYLRHGSGLLKDGWWQLHCDLLLDHPPQFRPEARMANDRVLRFMERSWMAQQLPLALLLFLLGGWAFVVWGICARVTVSVTGHWLVGYYAHNQGGMDNEVVGAAVQGRNVKWMSYATMGESWHNNHHAFPGSARLGLYPGQADPGWWVLMALRRAGLVRDVVLPGDLPARKQLRPLAERARAGVDDKEWRAACERSA